MGWIKRRIDKEKSKYEGKLDWSKIAEAKIKSQILEEFKERMNKLCVKVDKDIPAVIGVDLAIYELVNILGWEDADSKSKANGRIR